MIQKILILFFLSILCNFYIQCSNKGVVVEDFSDPKLFKQLLRSRNNVMVLFTKSKSDANSVLKAYKDAATAVRGIGTMIMVDCGGQGKKLCRQNKVTPDPNTFQHFKDGKFHKVYDRLITAKSFVRFMNDPTGEVPWEEEPSGKSVVHLENPSALAKLLKKHKKVLIMFYAPWCVYCKQMKPEYAAAASKARSSGLGILAAMDVVRPENSFMRTKYKVTGFPTVYYFEAGEVIATYEGENKEDKILDFLKDPTALPVKTKEVPWSEEESYVHHLNSTNFDHFLEVNPSVLVMFYAPWCGHCKRLKPDWVSVAQALHDDPKLSHHKMAAVDATVEKQLAEKFKVKSFPTIKYFKNAEFTFDTPTLRSKSVIMEFLRDPSSPPTTPPPEIPWEDIPSEVVHLTEDNFRTKLRARKRTLVMFYAPWCGHCKATKPEFELAAEMLKDDYRLNFAAFNCVAWPAFCKVAEIKGYPTFKHYNYHRKETLYQGGRKAKDFVDFMKSLEPEPLPAPVPLGDEEAIKKLHKLNEDEENPDHPGWDKLVHLTDENYKGAFKENKHMIVLFHARWCIKCRELKKSFAKVATEHDPNLVTLAACDVSKAGDISEMFSIESVPVIKYIRDGHFVMDYKGELTAVQLQDFVQQMKTVKKDEL